MDIKDYLKYYMDIGKIDVGSLDHDKVKRDQIKSSLTTYFKVMYKDNYDQILINTVRGEKIYLSDFQKVEYGIDSAVNKFIFDYIWEKQLKEKDKENNDRRDI